MPLPFVLVQYVLRGVEHGTNVAGVPVADQQLLVNLVCVFVVDL